MVSRSGKTILGVLKMKRFLSKLVISSSIGLIFLAACTPSQTTQNTTETSAPTSVETAPTETVAKDHSAPQKGGQVVEAGAYHLEFVALPESGGTHLDLYLQSGDTHEAVPGAKVMAQVQFPNGEQEVLDLEYDEAGKHYAVFFPGEQPGEYKVAILSDINGEKVNGRFNFTR